MADEYETTNWQTGDIITAERLNKLEQGVEAGQNAAIAPADLSGYDAAAANGKAVQVKADGSGFEFAEPAAAATTIPQGALVGGAGLSITRGEDGALTAKVADKGITAAMLADGVAASGPKGADGKSVTAIALTVDAAGKVTGGTATFSDKSTAAITVTTATA